MNSNPFLGVFLHALGGLAAGSFYIPFKKVRRWSWESYWLVNGVTSWVLVPWLVGILVCPDLLGVLKGAPAGRLLWSYLFGLIWGVGGLTFGLTMRYLGMSLGYALALGFCAFFGTIMPPLFHGELGKLAGLLSGQTTLGGMFVCLGGIAVCGLAGVCKERELTADLKAQTIREFNFAKGLWVAVFAGVMSACMAFALDAGKPIAELAAATGTPELWKNTPALIVIFAGGFTTNLIWCLFLNIKNRTLGDYFSAAPDVSLLVNYLFSALAGAIWYMQFMFYGMGSTQMGQYDFSSWTIHMAFIIVFSNLWGLFFREWRGASSRTMRLIHAGLAVLVASTLVVGLGNYFASMNK